MSTKPLSVSIGIPALNEAANIGQLLERLLVQTQKNYKLAEIIVITDGSTDTTNEVVKSIQSPLIKLHIGTQRVGQQARQNQLRSMYEGDILVIMEADTLPFNNDTINELVKPFVNAPRNLGMVVGIPIAVKPQTWFEKIMVFGDSMKRDMFLNWRKGVNVFSCGGHSMKAMSREFTSKLKWPNNVPEDAYTYLRLRELGLDLHINPKAKAYMRHVTHFSDRIKQCTKFQSGRRTLSAYFSKDVVKSEYEIPTKIKIKFILKYFFKNPVLLLLYLMETLLNRLITIRAKQFKAIHNTYNSSKTLVQTESKLSRDKSHSPKWTTFRKIVRIGITSLTMLAVLLILAVTIHGRLGNPTSKELNEPYWKEDGPLELSPDRGRFALTYSILEDNSYQFSIDVARFAAPDVAQLNGKYVSLFAPAVSYIVMPGYIVGKSLGISQVGSFVIIAFFAFSNFLLIRSISIRLGAAAAPATIAALMFLFGSPAFAYAVTLYQHHISTFLILASIYLLVRWKGVWPLLGVWFLCALSISVDNPNLFMMFPIGVFALGRLIILEKDKSNWHIKIKVAGFLTFVAMIIPVLFFLHFNKMSYGNPFQLAGTVPSAEVIDASGRADISDLAKKALEKQTGGQTVVKKKKTALGFFQTRRLLNGFYHHFISYDRGMIVYAPILLVGFLGVIVLGKSQPKYAQLALAIMGANILLYSMWGDPYGGWAFGSRYLIPSYAMLAIFCAMLLHKYHRHWLLLLPIFGLTIYSTSVNVIGAVTSNRNPPKIEVLSLEELTGTRQRYTFKRNMEMLNNNRSKSFFFQEWAKNYVTAWEFTHTIIGLLAVLYLIQFVWLLQKSTETQSVTTNRKNTHEISN